jgi:hypothetical protein
MPLSLHVTVKFHALVWHFLCRQGVAHTSRVRTDVELVEAKLFFVDWQSLRSCFRCV